MTTDETPVLESSQKLFSILEYVIQTGGTGVTNVANATSIAKSTVHLHLQSLQATGHVVKRGNEYHPSLQLFEWGERIRNNSEPYRKGREEINSLAEETNELVNLGVLENGTVRLVHLREVKKAGTDSSASSISTEFTAGSPKVSVLSDGYEHSLGRALNIHATAMGKAMLAEMPRGDVTSIVDLHGLPAHTENTITARDSLFKELEKVRSQGFAEDNEERVDGLSCVGAAICRNDEPVAAVSISGMANQLNGEYKEELARQANNTANMIEVKLSHS